MEKNNDEIFRSMPVPKAVATMAIPSIISMLVVVIYNMADTFFVGQTQDANQVAAVSLTMPVFLIFMALGNLFGIGGSSVISRTLGIGNTEKAKKISSFCFYTAIIVGAVITVVYLLGMDFILKCIGTDESNIDFSRDYMNIVSIGAIVIILSNALSNILRSEGAVKQAMVGMMIGTFGNIILDPILILNMDLGVKGAAIATVIGNMMSVTYYVVYLLGKKTRLSIKLKDCSFSEGIPQSVFAIGIPASLNNILMSASNIVLNNVLKDYENAVAAMGVAMKANMLVILLQIGLSLGVQPLIGYCYGAKNIERLKSVIRFSTIVAIVMGSFITLVYFFATNQIINAFIDDEAVIKYGAMMLRALMISGPVIGILFIRMNALQAMGKAIPALILNVSRQGFVFIPVLFILNYVLGLNGIIYAQVIADLISLIVAITMYNVIVSRELKKAS